MNNFDVSNCLTTCIKLGDVLNNSLLDIETLDVSSMIRYFTLDRTAELIQAVGLPPISLNFDLVARLKRA